ncbi:variant erythrocyte surface antigen-1 family protein, partial [Babesia divergens]
MASSGTTSGLLRCPKNLRECIDWVLRATGKDGQTGQTDNNIDKLNNALNAELKESDLTDELKELKALASGLKDFIGYGSNGRLTGTGIKGKSYESSYDSNNVTWKELCEECQCKSVSNSCSCSCPSVSSVCDPSQCCPDCDVRKAAKIFLGFLPSLYYALKYLNERCKKGEWRDQKISQDHSLGRFLVGMGYDLGKLDDSKNGSDIFDSLSSLFTGSNGPLEKLYNFSKNYFTSRFTSLVPSSTSSDSKPETVREMLLWLSGLPFIPGFKALLDHCKDLCKPVENSVKFIDFDNFKASLFDSCFLSPFVLGAIEDSEDNESEGFPLYKSEISKFYYPSDTLELFEKFCEYVRKIFVALIFLKFQCERPSDQAGWQDCYFGKECKVDPLASPSVSTSGSSSSPCCSTSAPNGYLCTASGQNKDVHGKHCAQDKCINANGSTCQDSSHNLNSQTRAGQKMFLPLPPPPSGFPHCHLRLPVPVSIFPLQDSR